MDEVTTKFFGDYLVIHRWANLEIQALTSTVDMAGYLLITPFRCNERGTVWGVSVLNVDRIEFGTGLHRAVEALMAGEVLQTIDWLRDNYPEETAALTVYLEERLVA